MATLAIRHALTLLLALSLSVSALAKGAVQSADEAMIRALIEQYFAAYAKKDLASITQMWSAKSPDLAAARSRLQTTFAANDQLEVKGLQLQRLSLEGERASLLVTIEVSGIEVKTG